MEKKQWNVYTSEVKIYVHTHRERDLCNRTNTKAWK